LYWNPRDQTALETSLVARYEDTLSTEIAWAGGPDKLAQKFKIDVRVTTNNERSAATTSFRKTFLSKSNPDTMMCSKVLKVVEKG